MGGTQRLGALGVLLGLVLSSAALAQVTSTRGASILVFPHVVFDDAHDTFVQIVNGSQHTAFLNCRYVGRTAAQEVDFPLLLTGAQPTHWVASHGRFTDPSDSPCNRANTDCDGAGIDPGRIPALATPFEGALLCVQVDSSGAPLSGNALRGTATLVDSLGGDIAKYDALGLIGYDTNNGDDVLCIDGQSIPACTAAEYSGCPSEWTLGHQPDGAPHPLAPVDDKVWTSITAAPCVTELGGDLSSILLQSVIYSEFEQRFTNSASLPPLTPTRLGAIDQLFRSGSLGSDFLQSHFARSGGSMLMLAETERAPNADAEPGGRTAEAPHAGTTGAAILTFPYLVVDAASGIDSIVQLSNLSDQPVTALCSYEDFSTSLCIGGNPGETCAPEAPTCTGACQGLKTSTTARLRLTPHQPLGWRASSGLSEFPIPDGANSNAGSELPAVGDSFRGDLRCIAVGDDDLQVARNDLIGSLTVETYRPGAEPFVDAAQYAAIGTAALPEAGNGDAYAVMGGPEPEYESCPGVAVLPFVFDGATLHSGSRTDLTQTTLALVPCTTDLTADRGSKSVVQFLVYNEFEQRFSTSRPVEGQLAQPLSLIDTTQADRSIFHAGVAGTESGQTYIMPFGAGVVGVAIETHIDPTDALHRSSAAVQLHEDGAHPKADLIQLPGALCIGDCDRNGAVELTELMQAVNINLDRMPMSTCQALDRNHDTRSSVDEVIGAVRSSLEGCPGGVAPTPTVSPTPPPTLPPPAEAGPDITYLGIAGADDVVQTSDTTDDDGRPVFVRPNGHGFSLLIEARPGTSHRAPGSSSFVQGGDQLPDWQIIVSRALGDGSAAVCDLPAGGVPATQPFEFSDQPAVIAAVNDLGCHADNGQGLPGSRPRALCSKTADGSYEFVNRGMAQVCVPIEAAWEFPSGDTIVAVRVLSVGGEVGPQREIVVRVP